MLIKYLEVSKKELENLPVLLVTQLSKKAQEVWKNISINEQLGSEEKV